MERWTGTKRDFKRTQFLGLKELIGLGIERGKGDTRMNSKPRKLNVKSKIWIEDENGDVVFGAGRLKILIAIEEHGSILSAAKAIGMGYRAMWGKIKATEDRLGQPLLTKRTGGGGGGGSELTPFAKLLIKRYRKLDNLTKTKSDRLFRDVFVDALVERGVV